MRKIAATSALLIGTAVIGCGTAHAAPAPIAPVTYTATTLDNAALISTDGGALVVENGALKIKAADGTTVAGTELSFRVDDFVFPVAAEISGRTATLTPQFDLAHAAYQPVAFVLDDAAQREALAWQRLTSTILAGAAVGTAIGGLGGGAIGCVLGGAAAGAGATLATGIIGGLFSFLPAAAGGCIAGAAALGALGTLVGTLLVTAPVMLAAAAQYFTTVNAPLPAPRPAN